MKLVNALSWVPVIGIVPCIILFIHFDGPQFLVVNGIIHGIGINILISFFI